MNNECIVVWEAFVFRFLFKKQHQVELLIYNYLDNLKTTRKHFAEAMDTCLDRGVCDHFSFLIEQTHKFESRADDIREEIKTLMYEKALIPESRGDIMGLLESIDEIPRIFERLLYMIKTQKLVLPDFIIPDTKDLIELSLENCDLMFKQVEQLFKREKGIRVLVSEIDLNESHCDHIERLIVTKLFNSDIDPFQKLQIKDLVDNMGDIADQTDRVSKRVNIISMKRSV